MADSSAVAILLEHTKCGWSLRKGFTLQAMKFHFYVWLCIKLGQGVFFKLAVTSKLTRRKRRKHYYPASEMKTVKESGSSSKCI